MIILNPPHTVADLVRVVNTLNMCGIGIPCKDGGYYLLIDPRLALKLARLLPGSCILSPSREAL